MSVNLELEEDVIEAAQKLALQRGISLEALVSDFIRNGLHSSRIGYRENGLPYVILPPGSPAISLEAIKKAQEEMY